MGKTQVFSMVQNDLITTRGLHVQLVSKIARNLGRALGYNEDSIYFTRYGRIRRCKQVLYIAIDGLDAQGGRTTRCAAE